MNVHFCARRVGRCCGGGMHKKARMGKFLAWVAEKKPSPSQADQKEKRNVCIAASLSFSLLLSRFDVRTPVEFIKSGNIWGKRMREKWLVWHKFHYCFGHTEKKMKKKRREKSRSDASDEWSIQNCWWLSLFSLRALHYYYFCVGKRKGKWRVRSPINIQSKEPWQLDRTEGKLWCVGG